MLMDRAITIMSYFGLRKYGFDNENMRRLTAAIAESECLSQILQFDMRTIDWADFFRYYIPGIRKYYFKQTDAEALRKCQRLYRQLKFYHDVLKLLVWTVLPILVCYRGGRRVRMALSSYALK